VDTERRRKLLLHKKQILQLEQRVKERGYALIPLSMYFNSDGRVKVEVGVCKGKKNYDKRASIAERDAKRDVARALKERSR
jgi:SsrA-binding protein